MTMINLEDNLRQHEVTEALELDSIEWFREEIGELQLRRAVHELNTFLDNKLLEEPESNFVMLGVANMPQSRLRLSYTCGIVLPDLERSVRIEHVKINKKLFQVQGVLRHGGNSGVDFSLTCGHSDSFPKYRRPRDRVTKTPAVQ